MIHVMDFEGNIIDYISESDNAVTHAVHKRDINDRLETFVFRILSKRSESMQRRNRIIIQDKNGLYREFIIDHISQDIDGYTEIETVASYLEDITKAEPYAPGKLEKMTTRQALSDVLKDTGWIASDMTEYGGTKTTSWSSYQTRYEVLIQLCTTYDMMVDFFIELGSNKVDNRYVVLKKRTPLFKGKEIAYGKDLIGLQRVVDFNDVKTALLCLGPERDDGSRLELVVKDDEAQSRIGLPGRYNWGIYEPESDDSNMSESRLRTLGNTELNKRKKEAITYEVTALDIQKQFKHEIVNLGDLVRIKNRDFTPPLYVEAEAISEEFNLISKNVTYGFGQYVEYKESDLRSEFTKKLDSIRQKLNDGLTNVNTIVADVVEGKLEYFERKIFKGSEPPENPVNDMLWLDTSNPDVAVLRRYWEGQWINATAEKAEDIGAITREKALYSELTNTFVNLSIQHSKLLNEMHDVINSEYLVDFDLKDELNTKLDATVSIYNNIKSNLESMTDETATIGKLIDTQTLFLNYRTAMQNLYNVVERAKIAIDERFKLLQSQYTEEKFRNALQEIADKFGLQVNEQNQLIGEPNVVEKVVIAAREDTKEQLRDYVKSVDYQTNQQGLIERMESADAERKTLAGQISDRVTKSEYQSGLDNIKIGNRNLLLDSSRRNDIMGTPKYKYIKYKLSKPLEVGKEYTLSFDYKIIEGNNENRTSIMGLTPNTSRISIDLNDGGTTYTFKADNESTSFLIYTGLAGTDSNDTTKIQIDEAMLVEGNIAGNYTEAPEDVERSTDKKLSVAKTEILQDGEQISQRVSREVFNASSQTLNRVVSEFVNNTSDGMTFRYDENGNFQSHSIGPQGVKIKGDKVDIKLNKEFNLLVGDVSKKADETNIINKINLSREGLDINVNNIGLRGGDSVNYLEIKNNSVLSRGRFTRTWANNTDAANLTLGIRNGYLLVSNEDNGYNLYMTEKGLSTMMNAASGETAGTLEFHYQGYNENSRGVRLHSTYGAVALESDQSRIYTVANLTNNIESRQYGVYIRPFKDTRIGLNEFYFYVKDNDSDSDTDGAILYGNISDPEGQHGAGIRFSKSRTENIVYATNEKGDIGSGDFYASNLYGSLRAKSTNQYVLVAYDGELRVTDKNGASGSSINYRPVRTNELKTTHSYAFSNHSGADVYFGVGMNEMRITDNNFYNGGRTSYKPVRALDFIKSSRAEYKEEIKLWDYDALSVITNDLLLYSYKYKDDIRGLMQHGPVIGDGYKTPTEFIFGDGINTNEMLSWALRAIQQLNEKLEALQNERTS